MSVMNPGKKYAPIAAVPIKNREWPDRRITKAPLWCSVDLRDGNQALVNPMGIETKLAFFDLLVKIGFKEIASRLLSKEKYMDAFQAARYKTIPMFVIKAKNIE